MVCRLYRTCTYKVVKEPGCSGNNHGYETQICQFLDHVEKVCNFSLFTSICKAGVQFGAMEEEEAGEEEEKTSLCDNFLISTTLELLPFLWTSGYDTGTSWVPDYFHTMDLVKEGLSGLSGGAGWSSLQPPQTYQKYCISSHLWSILQQKKWSLKLLNCITYLISLQLSEALFYTSLVIQQIAILIQLERDATSTKTVYLFLISRSRKKYGFRWQCIIILTTSSQQAYSIHHQCNTSIVSLALWLVWFCNFQHWPK